MESATLEAVPNEAPAEEELHDGDLVIDGAGQLGWTVGGKRPDTSSLRLVGGKVNVDGQYDKGQTIKLELTCEVSEVAFVDQRDSKTNQIIGCDRRHRARVVAVAVV